MSFFEFNGAYSLGTSQRSKLFANESGKFPGPGNYQMPNFKNKPKSPEVEFAKGRRSINYDNGLPGPGKYTSGFSHLDKSIPIKISKPHNVTQKPATIGPGSYDPKGNVESSKQKLPTYSFGYRITQEVVSDTPAPNAYYPENVNTMFKTQSNFGSTMRSNTNLNNNNNNNDFNTDSQQQPGDKMRRTQSSSMMSRNTRNGFGGSERMKSTAYDGPGPGEYSAKLGKLNGGPTFAKSQRHWIQPSDNPGHKYNIGASNPDDASLGKSNGFSFGQKLHDSLKTYENYIPGPGTYDGGLPKSQQGTRFGSEQKHSMVDKESLKKPGPNYYYPLVNSKSEIYIPTIGFSTRPPLSQNGLSPGPAEYFKDIERQTIGEGPKWKMAARFVKKNKADQPGPGAYDVQAEAQLQQRPKFGYTTGPRSNPVRSEFANTGPGSYDISGRLNNNKFGITASERFYGKKNINEPGPGTYNIGGTIGKIPSYLMLSKKKHSQLLGFDG